MPFFAVVLGWNYSSRLEVTNATVECLSWYIVIHIVNIQVASRTHRCPRPTSNGMRKILYTVSGKVIKGVSYGRRLGYPTANLDRREYMRKKMAIPFGIYAGLAKTGAKTYSAGIIIGPIDVKGLPKIEAHLLDFSADIYGKRVELSLLEYVRPFETFSDEGVLKKQIAHDIRRIRAFVFRG